jgi:hypothetical protein
MPDVERRVLAVVDALTVGATCRSCCALIALISTIRPLPLLRLDMSLWHTN